MEVSKIMWHNIKKSTISQTSSVLYISCVCAAGRGGWGRDIH